MQDRFENREELAAKIEWEGGIEDALDFGITAEMMPEGDTELIGAWHELDLLWKPLRSQLDVVYSMLS